MHRFNYNMSQRQAELIFAQVASHIGALKNWTASAVERGELERAQTLVGELREYEKLYAAFNIEAKFFIARNTDKPVETDVII